MILKKILGKGRGAGPPGSAGVILTTLSLACSPVSPSRFVSGALCPVTGSQLPCRSYVIRLTKSKFLVKKFTALCFM